MASGRVSSSSQGRAERPSSSPAAPMKPSEVLAKAADLIEPKGAWTRGAFSRKSARHKGKRRYVPFHEARCFCVLGAIAHVLGGNADETRAVNSDAARYLDRLSEIGREGPVSFNDAPGRTQAEVVAALRKAADLARSEGA